MRYILKRDSQFGTVLDDDGRTVIGRSVTVKAGSLVEFLSVGALDMMLTKHTNSDGQACYGWLFFDDVETIKDGQQVVILRDVTQFDLTFGDHRCVVYEAGKVYTINPNPEPDLRNDEWPTAVWMADRSDWWFLPAGSFEILSNKQEA